MTTYLGVPQDPASFFTLANATVPGQVFSGGSPFTLTVDLAFSGFLDPFIVSLLQGLGATYFVTYSFESETGGTSGTFGTDSGSLAGLTTTSTITVPANFVPPDVYELTGNCTISVLGSNSPYFGAYSDLDVVITA